MLIFLIVVCQYRVIKCDGGIEFTNDSVNFISEIDSEWIIDEARTRYRKMKGLYEK